MTDDAAGPAPVAVALDTGELPRAVQWASAVGPYVSTCKVGLELYLRHGAAAVFAVANAAGRPVFLDLKLHDIPATVAGAARSVAELEPAYDVQRRPGEAERCEGRWVQRGEDGDPGDEGLLR